MRGDHNANSRNCRTRIGSYTFHTGAWDFAAYHHLPQPFGVRILGIRTFAFCAYDRLVIGVMVWRCRQSERRWLVKQSKS